MNNESLKPGFFEKFNNWLKRSVSIKIFTIGILILLLLIPLAMVEDLIRERRDRNESAINEVSSKWGESQTIKGPVLTVPYLSNEKIEDGRGSYTWIETKSYAHFLPDDLKITGEVDPETRKRGIYEVIVYNAKLQMTGSFKTPDFKILDIEPTKILWQESFVSLGISDLRSVQESVSIQWGDSTYAFNPGVECKDVIDVGVSTRVTVANLNMEKDAVVPFSMSLNFNGSSSLYFSPFGRNTTVELKSDWPGPSFDGAFLPDVREVTDKGFSCKWKVLHLNRSFPQQFKGSHEQVNQYAFGVNLKIPVDEYQKSMRSAKYAAMLITLTFIIFFFIQVLNGVRMHPIQYIMIGLALCIFYTLLVALSEHMSFGMSYFISAAAITLMITLYAHSMFGKKLLTALILLILMLLYLFIYTIIQMEDYSLLIGSIGLFLVLATVMYLSRKINWYSIGDKAGK